MVGQSLPLSCLQDLKTGPPASKHCQRNKGSHPTVLRAPPRRLLQEVTVPKTEYRQRLHGWTTQEMAEAQGRSEEMEERRRLQQAMKKEQVKRRAAELRARQTKYQASRRPVQPDQPPKNGQGLQLNVVGETVGFAQRDKVSPKVHSGPAPTPSQSRSAAKTPTKLGSDSGKFKAAHSPPSVASTRTPSEVDSCDSRPSTASSRSQATSLKLQPEQAAAETAAAQKQAQSATNEPLKARAPLAEGKGPSMRTQARENATGDSTGKVGRALIKALQAWWEQKQAERVPLQAQKHSPDPVREMARAKSAGCLPGQAAEVRDVGHWGSLPETGWHGHGLDRGASALRSQKDCRVRGAKYMPRPASMGRIPAVGSPEFCVDRI